VGGTRVGGGGTRVGVRGSGVAVEIDGVGLVEAVKPGKVVTASLDVGLEMVVLVTDRVGVETELVLVGKTVKFGVSFVITEKVVEAIEDIAGVTVGLLVQSGLIKARYN
jgi:hypothetical protein